MASKIKVDQIAESTSSANITFQNDVIVPTGKTITIADGVPVASGGTSLTSFTAGDVLYATGPTTLAKLPKGTAEQVLAMNAGATAPDWGSVDLTVLPTISVAKGGTGQAGGFTQGDFLYATDATTLAKLAKGTAAQTLKMNAGATAPEWVTASSGDYTKIAVAGSGVDVGYVSIPIDRATYTTFDIFWHSVPATDGGHLEGRIRNSGGAITGSNYKSSYVQTQGDGGSISSNHENGAAEFKFAASAGYTDLEGHGMHFEYTPHLTSRWGQSGGTYNGELLTWQGYRIDGSDSWRDVRGGGKYDIVEDGVTHLDIFYSTGNIAMHNYTIYGRKA